MCKDCGQFNHVVTIQATKVLMHDGSELLFDRQTRAGRRNGRLQDTRTLIGAIWGTGEVKKLMDVEGDMVEVIGRNVQRMVGVTISKTYYQKELLRTHVH